MNKSCRILIFLTVIGGGLRFFALGHPSIWGDEAWTFSRVCGSYRDMLDLVSIGGFAPLHYELYWWIGQQIKLTPIVMRLIPAISGTLMIPAVYFLARQLVSVRNALLSALIACTSAYLLVYSRDAKMYMPFWLMCTLSVACLLWWVRGPTRVRWYCWVASSIAMIGLHAPGLILLGIEALFFLSHRGLNLRRAGVFVLGVLVIVSGISIYYARFSKLKDHVLVEKASRGSTQPSYEVQLGKTGIFWVPWYNQGRDGPQLVLYATTAFLFSWEYPKDAQIASIPPRTYRTLSIASYVILGLLALGLLPWRIVGTTNPRFCGPPLTNEDHGHSIPSGGPQDRGFDSSAPIEWWRALLWITCWIVLPAYGFYCMSVADFTTPLDWLRGIGTLNWRIVLIGLIVLAIAFILCDTTWRKRGTKAGLLVIILTVTWLLCVGVAIAFRNTKSESVWLPRYLGVIWPAVAIAIATLLLRLPTRPLRIGAISLFVVINLLQYTWRVFDSEPPTALLARDVIDAQPKSATTRTYTKISRLPGVEPGEGVIGSPAFRYYLAVFSSVPVAPDQFMIGRSDPNLTKYEDRFKFWPIVQNPFMQGFVYLPGFVPTNLRSSPSIRRIVVWDLFEPKDADLAQQDHLLPQLLGWRRTSQQIFNAYDHWRWRWLYTCRRSVYEKRL